MKVVFLFAAMMMLVGCGSGGSSSSVDNTAANKAAYNTAVAKINDIYARWKDADSLASVTPKIALSGPYATIQAIKREAGALVVPECLNGAMLDLNMGMTYVDSGYYSFMLYSGGSFYFEAAPAYFAKFEAALADPKTCGF